jgi:hypothetical protein
VVVDKDVNNFSKKIQENIYQIEAFSYSLFIVSIFFIFYFCLLDIDDYFNLGNFSFKQLFGATSILFTFILIIVLEKTKHSSRRHLMIPSTFFILLPACFLSGILFLYHLNIYLDTSPSYISNEKIFTEYKKSGKSSYYYLYFDNSKNPYLIGKKGFQISSNKYHRLSNVSEEQFTVRQGYFNIPYIKINNKYEKENLPN